MATALNLIEQAKNTKAFARNVANALVKAGLTEVSVKHGKASGAGIYPEFAIKITVRGLEPVIVKSEIKEYISGGDQKMIKPALCGTIVIDVPYTGKANSLPKGVDVISALRAMLVEKYGYVAGMEYPWQFDKYARYTSGSDGQNLGDLTPYPLNSK